MSSILTMNDRITNNFLKLVHVIVTVDFDFSAFNILITYDEMIANLQFAITMNFAFSAELYRLMDILKWFLIVCNPESS